MTKDDLKIVEFKTNIQVRKENKDQDVEIGEKGVYLLENGLRVNKICGYEDNGWYCERPAGHKTTHVGSGFCSIHGGLSEFNDQKYLARLSNIISKNSSLGESLEIFDKDMDVTDPKDLVVLLRVLLENHVSLNQYDLKSSNINNILKIIEQIRRLLETSSKIEVNKAMTNAVLTIISEVINILKVELDPSQFIKVADKIKNIELNKEVLDIDFEEI